MKKEIQFKILFKKSDGEVITPPISAIAERRYPKRDLAQAFCDGVNDFRASRLTGSDKGVYIVRSV